MSQKSRKRQMNDAHTITSLLSSSKEIQTEAGGHTAAEYKEARCERGGATTDVRRYAHDLMCKHANR